MILEAGMAVGAAAAVFFLLLGILYIWDPDIPSKIWFGILFLLVAITIIFFLLQLPDLAGILIAAIAAFVGKNLLLARGIGK